MDKLKVLVTISFTDRNDNYVTKNLIFDSETPVGSVYQCAIEAADGRTNEVLLTYVEVKS